MKRTVLCHIHSGRHSCQSSDCDRHFLLNSSPPLVVKRPLCPRRFDCPLRCRFAKLESVDSITARRQPLCQKHGPLSSAACTASPFSQWSQPARDVYAQRHGARGCAGLRVESGKLWPTS